VKAKDFIAAVMFVVLCFLAGALGSVYTYPSIPTWYAALNKPYFNPPNFLFGPVWTLLYLLMGISAAIVWSKSDKNKSVDTAINIFMLQLGLNTLWSIIFFGYHRLFFALVEIILLWLAILWCTIAFFKISKPAGWMMIPYILWVSFAAVLTASVWLLN